jgi:rhodanese-related sulfurtransferase/DNA-binding transcriptional ArsR family regulator
LDHRQFKDPLYAQFARIGHAVSSPKRIELLDLLSQGPKTVETLAEQADMPIKNTSAHLRVLRHALLVENQRVGTHVHYRLANDGVFHFLRGLQTLAHERLAEVEKVASLYLTQRDELQPISLKELRQLIRDGSVTVIDVRPRSEYEAGHIPGALSVPVAQLKRRLSEIPKKKEVVAYCRGPYCVYSIEAVEILRKHGYRARRTDEGLPDWKAENLPVTVGDAS